ncbi:MAG: penicillin-binding protein 2, partial [Ignavibacteria bacterium]
MIKARAYLSFFFMVLIFFGLIARLYRIQIEQHDELSIRALKHHYASQSVKAERGRIFDRNGDLLVYSKNEISFYVNNKNKKNDVADSVVAAAFSKVFGKPFQHYMELLSIDKSRVCLEKKVSNKYKNAFKNLHCNRLYSETDNSRFYPYGSLAAHVLGYVNRELKGVNGIERYLDEELKGKDGKLTFQIDARKNIIAVEEKISVPPIDGKNVVLTIDKNYQSILDEELLNGFNKFGGEAAVGIIVDPNTGEILALSNIPNYDPANYNLFDNESRRNRAISDVYEPGSTIKSVFLSMLFEEKLASPNEIINTENGKYKLYSKWIRDTHSYEKLTVREVLEHSSNVGIVKLSNRISPNKFYKYLRDFGFGNETHIDLPG